MKNFARKISLVIAIVMVMGCMLASFVSAADATYTADLALDKTVNGRFYIGAYNVTDGKVYAVETEATTTWSADWPGNWVAGSDHDGGVAMAVTQRPEGSGVFDMYPTNDAMFSSVVAFVAPVEGTYSVAITLDKTSASCTTNVKLLTSTGTVLYDADVADGGVANYEAADVALAANDQIWLVVGRGAGMTNPGGYNMSVVSYVVTGPESDAGTVDAPAAYPFGNSAPETEAPETNAPETNAPETNAPETNAPETNAPETEAPVAPDTSDSTIAVIGLALAAIAGIAVVSVKRR